MMKIRTILAALLAVAFLVTSAPSVSADTGDTSTSVCGGTGNPCPPPPCGGTGNPCPPPPPPPCGGTGNPCPVVPDPCATPQSVTDGLAAILADNVALTGQVASLRTTNVHLRAKIRELRQKIRQLG